MIYKNYISGKNLSGLDIYISICLACFYYHFRPFIIITIIIIIIIIICLVFFCKLWRLVNANCGFCIFVFCIIYTLICLVLIRNICYLLLTY